MKEKTVQMEDTWYEKLHQEFEKPYFQFIKNYLKKEKSLNKEIYPSGPLIFNAFNKTPFDKVKVIILGQDPYHQPGQAMGLSFSVPQGTRKPPSLVNIYKEIERDTGDKMPDHGDLTAWAEQGVFLLNSILTVERNMPGSHQKIGWELFTDRVMQILSCEKDNIVFMLWGNFARKKKAFLNADKHLILESAHPSPLAGNKFFGNGHFSACNAYLESKGIQKIDWIIK